MTYIYRYMSGTSGIEQTIDFTSLIQALRKAAWDHESCGLRVPLEIQAIDEGYSMNQHEILEKCNELGLFK